MKKYISAGALLISSNRNDVDRSRLMADADLYKPRFSDTIRYPCAWTSQWTASGQGQRPT